MRVETFMSSEGCDLEEVITALDSWPDEPDVVFVFASPEWDLDGVARYVDERFAGTPWAGASTAGEHLSGTTNNKSLVATALYGSNIPWRTAWIPDARVLDAEEVGRCVRTLDHQFDQPDLEFHGVIFVDGLCMNEGRLAELLTITLPDVTFIGGSAGDDQRFESTWVGCDKGRGNHGAAIAVAASAPGRIRVLTHQHFVPDDRSVVVTRADAKRRVIYELDGRRADLVWAEALGVPGDRLQAPDMLARPMLYPSPIGDVARSIQSVREDGGLQMYCAVEEGMLLDIGIPRDIVRALDEDLRDFEPGRFALVCNCILRSVEAVSQGQRDALADALRNVAETVVGFDTYGELRDGLHINHTLVGLTIDAARDA